MNKTNPAVDAYLSTVEQWQEELQKLRKIVLGCGLTEELKWGGPCYTVENRNVLILGGFKEYCALSFFKGALLKDPNGLLVKPGENTQSARLIRLTSVKEIARLKPILEAYVYEAVELEKAGAKVAFKKTAEPMPEELQNQFDAMPRLQTAFEALTPGRQRAYLLFFAAAKQSETRTARIEKYTQQILDGKGINDCTCGLSKKLPACDGSHNHAR